LVGRRAECEAIDRLVADVAAGRSRVLVLRGEAGVGKTALLGHLSERVDGWRVVRAEGVEPELELAYSGLQQWCAPLLENLAKVPGPQRGALETVLGLRDGTAPDPFLVGLATLTLMAEAAEEQPLACIVDDAQWLDRASARVLEFVARRLLVERVAVVGAARTAAGDDVLAGMPALTLRGLGDEDARTLLLSRLPGPLDPAVTDQLVAESHGNPLALLELPRASRLADLAGGFGLPDGRPVAGRIEQSYLRRLRVLPAATRLLVLAAAAEPLGNPVLLQGAAEDLGMDLAALTPAVDAGLLRMGGRVEFTHPLVRSATYRAADPEDRRRVHRALAQATDADADPDRRAWHRARASPGPDEDVAAELERSAGRAQARAGLAAAAAFLRRSVALTQDPARRTERALAAARASLQAGTFATALGIVATVEAGPLDEFERAHAALVRGQVAFASEPGGDTASLLLTAARRLEPFDPTLARETYLTARSAAGLGAHLTGAGALLEISRAIRALPPPRGDPPPLDLLLDGLARLTIEGHAAATPSLKRAAQALAHIPVAEVLRWGWAATGPSAAVWDHEGYRAISARHVSIVRGAGALAQLPIHLSSAAMAVAWTGDFAGADSLVAEIDDVASVTGGRVAPYALLRLRALQGSEAEAASLIAGAGDHPHAHWAAAVLYNGLARHEEALPAARRAAASTFDPWASMWALPELVESAARAGNATLARDALDRLVATTQHCGTDLGLGIEARCRALLGAGPTAEHRYREAIDRLDRTQLRPEVARARLLYGEWLRGAGRRTEAREQLRAAHGEFAEIGMAAFADRARRGLTAAGGKVRDGGADTRDRLTPQEEQVARLARDGLSNAEIGAHLFISARTVEWHLRKVFAKLGVTSRRQLRHALRA
jgi:DNA-binding CsgD family transcriptional regulator